MKKKLINFTIFVLIFLLPFINVSAVTWKYRFKRMPISDIVSNYQSEMLISSSGTCKNDGNGNHPGCMKLSYIGGKYTLAIHEVNNGSSYYHGYCLHAGKQIYENATIGSHKGFDDLPNINEKTLSDKAQEVLKNIVASGYQNKKGNIGNIVKGNYSALGTCPSKDRCRKVLVTQVLVWEVTSGARTNYAYKPNVSNPSNSPHNVLIDKNSSLESYYKQVLSKAKEMSSEGSLPDSLGKTHILKWSDAKNAYISNSINIGDYDVTTKNTSTLTISSKNKKNEVIVTSTNKINSKKEIKVEKIVGNYSDESLSFRWFRFGKDKNGYAIKNGTAQDVLLGDYARKFDNKFYVKTESGSFKISKVDADTKKTLLGSKFNLYKCSGTNCSSKTLLREIDLTSQAQTVSVSIDKSGTYLFEETKVPYGYENLGEFMVDFNINGSNAEITKIYTNSANIQKLDNGTLVKNSLVIENAPKNFTINKIDGTTNKPINGATFQIKDSKGNLVKFELLDGKYRYSTSGTITNLVDQNSSSYVITLLPKGDYSIIETAVPYPYSLSSSEKERTTEIRIDANADLLVKNSSGSYVKSTNAAITIKNFKTIAEIIKSGDKGEFLEGVKFELYDANKKNQIRLVQSSESVYDYSQDQSIEPIQIITNSVGKITINYLPTGKYFVKETVTVGGHVIDQTVEWTELEIIVNKDNSPKVTKTIRNAKATFNFYKIDEDGNYLSSGKFKLQKYNEKRKKFEDVTLLYNEEDNTYTIDKTNESDIIVFTPKNGIVTFVDVEAKARYRVVEIEAPEGFVLPKTSETQAEIVINENGYALGDSVIINRKITVGEGAQASAELIINISTGQNRIRYILIISILSIIIIGLFIINRKIRKK